ncbi:MAG: PspC domain-containing protein [Hungatella sp.]|nr:PspC domain-containing protein [Hungatella sp.]
MGRKLYKSSTNRMVCGVCGGIGEYFNVDPTIVRLVWAIFACSGAGIIAYFIAAIIIPSDTLN